MCHPEKVDRFVKLSAGAGSMLGVGSVAVWDLPVGIAAYGRAARLVRSGELRWVALARECHVRLSRNGSK